MSPRWRVNRCLPLVLLLALPAAHADDTAAERARIAAERAQVAAAFDARADECQRRFAVTACMNEAQRVRRDALDVLRRQQVLLDEAQRKQRAAQRIEAIRNKVAAEEAAQRAGGRPKPPPAATLTLRQAPPAHAGQGAQAAPPRQDPTQSPGQRAAVAEQQRLARQRSQQARQADALAHQQAVERRNAARAASGKKPAAPLPVPAGASAAGGR